MTACPAVAVLLATFNSVRYGPQLLESLLAQTLGDFELIVRDDGSTDGTPQMLRDIAPRFGGRMRVLEGGVPTGSAKGNFAALMAACDADYAFFADHDDVWKPEKLAVTLALLREVEARRGPEVPAFAFTNLEVIDGQGAPLFSDYWRFKKIRPEVAADLAASLVCPAMLGCASGANRALMRIATPVPCDAVTGHDWWLQLVAATFGEVGWSAARTMFYRLHGGNASDQKRVSLGAYASASGKVAKVRRGMMLRRAQAQALIDVFGDRLPADRRTVLERFVRTGRQGFLRRRLELVRGGHLYPDAPRTLAMLLAT